MGLGGTGAGAGGCWVKLSGAHRLSNDYPDYAVVRPFHEALVRATTADMLFELGYLVVQACGADEALQVLEERKIDLVVTDHLMPGMTGTELAHIMRARQPGLPILVISGYAELEGIAPDLPRLAKPFRGEDLSVTLAGLRRSL